MLWTKYPANCFRQNFIKYNTTVYLMLLSARSFQILKGLFNTRCVIYDEINVEILEIENFRLSNVWKVKKNCWLLFSFHIQRVSHPGSTSFINVQFLIEIGPDNNKKRAKNERVNPVTNAFLYLLVYFTYSQCFGLILVTVSRKWFVTVNIQCIILWHCESFEYVSNISRIPQQILKYSNSRFAS